MSEEGDSSTEKKHLNIPKIKAESETQTTGFIVSVSPDRNKEIEREMENQQQSMSIRKRRNLSKNRGQATRQREKTPEPGRTPVLHEDTTTSDDEETFKPQRSSRELEADNTYKEMKRMVQEQSTVKDPVYDMDFDEILQARVKAASERRRRSVSPFAVQEKEEATALERKGSFMDPANKLLSTTYTLSPKEEDTSRRNSLTIEPPRERKNSLSPGTPTSNSPKDNFGFNYPIPTTPKRLEEMVYPDEGKISDNQPKSKPTTPAKQENVFTFDEKESKPKSSKPITPKAPETSVPPAAGEIVTKVVELERTPSRKLSTMDKPVVEIRQRVVRTPSRKSVAEVKPLVPRQPPKQTTEEPKKTPVKPARSLPASRFGGKTSESEMSEDQAKAQHINTIVAPKRKEKPTPRRFLRRTPKENRSQSVTRAEEMRIVDKTGTRMSQTSKEIIELMQQARARSLSIPKDDPRLPTEYKNYNRNLMTPKKTPSSPKRSARGISCPKTIQIISDKEILASLAANKKVNLESVSRQSSGYIDASQSEYTSSCYSSSPSDNEYNFDLADKTAELTMKLHLLSQEVDQLEDKNNILLAKDDYPSNELVEPKSVLRKRNNTASANGTKKAREVKEIKSQTKTIIKIEQKTANKPEVKVKNRVQISKWKLIATWQQFIEENRHEYETIKLQRNRCVCDLLILVIMCGLGGMMFKTLEGSFENAYKCGTRNVKRDFIENLWRGSHYMREEDWKSMARKKLHEFEDQLHTAHEAGVTSYSGQKSWNFMNSFVYCLTLVTTIGYGHIAPKTIYGRIATIVYAIIGIPLFLIVLADFGKLFTRIIKFFWSFIRRFYYTRSCKKVRHTVPVQEVMKGLNIVYDVVRRPSQIFSEEDMVEAQPDGSSDAPPVQRKLSDVPPPLPPKPGAKMVDYSENDNGPETPAPSVFEIDDEFNLPISVAIFILIVYIIIGAVGYNIWETWNFFESFYFVFISMSTIGLGDLVPDHPMFMMASILYLVFGLALTSMCINVVQEKLSDTFKKASAKIGATIGLKVAEEDGSLVPMTPPPTEIAPVHLPKKEVTQVEEEKNKADGNKPIGD